MRAGRRIAEEAGAILASAGGPLAETLAGEAGAIERFLQANAKAFLRAAVTAGAIAPFTSDGHGHTGVLVDLKRPNRPGVPVWFDREFCRWRTGDGAQGDSVLGFIGHLRRAQGRTINVEIAALLGVAAARALAVDA